MIVSFHLLPEDVNGTDGSDEAHLNIGELNFLVIGFLLKTFV